jgi:hypothetical protein
MVNKTTVKNNNKKKPVEIDNKNNKNNNKNNKKPAEIDNKNKKPAEIDDNKKKPEETTDDKGALDEKGNPYPIENPEGGDPICPGGYKIDYQFDIFDPINPLFRCVPALKEDGDSVAGKLLKMANNPSGGVANIMTGPLPGFGGGKHRSRSHRHRLRRSHRSSRHICRSRRRRHRKSS